MQANEKAFNEKAFRRKHKRQLAKLIQEIRVVDCMFSKGVLIRIANDDAIPMPELKAAAVRKG